MSDQPSVPDAQPGIPVPSHPTGPPPEEHYSTTARGPRAGFWQRFAASFADGILLSIVGGILGLFLGQDLMTTDRNNYTYYLVGGNSFLGLLIQAAYFIYFEGSSDGQTLGKRLLGIRVISAADGGRIGYGSAAIRWIGRFVSTIALLLGYLWMLWDPEKQTWHDKFAKSLVVPASAYPTR